MTIEPTKLYTAPEVQKILRFKRVKTVYEIPEEDLSRLRIGKGRRQVRFLGQDLLDYLGLGPSEN